MIERYYPEKISAEARAAIEIELIQAGRAHDKGKPPGNDSISQASLPELPQSTKRKLDLRWSTLKEKYHLDGGHLHWHEKARRRRSVVAQMDQIRILSSVNVAGYRFTDLAYAYWSIWNPATPHEVFASWLDAIRRRTSSDIESVWKEKSDAVDGWYTKTCNPAVQKQLDIRVREWTKKARATELAHLERRPAYHKTGIAAIQPGHFQKGDGECMASEVRKSPPSAPSLGVPAKRGRPPTLSNEKKAAAQKVKNEGRSNRDAASILYDAKHPSRKQVINVSSVLGKYRKKIAAKHSVSD